MGISHPVIPEPDKRVYHTSFDDGPVVTFYHKQHIELYGLRCANCHQKENCSYCHDLAQKVNIKKSMEEVHATCNNCHSDDRCARCHDTGEKPAFTHASTGWELNEYHVELNCRSCHPTGRKIGRLDKTCRTCHGGWNQENFDHTVTGLRLDEIHIEADCADCHTDEQYDREPSCADCHDEEHNTRNAVPGERIKMTKK